MAWPLHITPFESSKNIQDRCLSFIAGACCKDTPRHPAHVGAQPAVAIWRLDCGWMHDAFNGDCHGGVQKAWHFTTFTGTPVGASSEICTCWFWFVSFILFHCATASFCVGPVFSTLVALWPGDAKADNCVRENKNNTVLKWACYMVAAGKLDLCSALFSRVGHTHGSLGVWDCTLWVWFRELFPRVFQTIWMESFDSALSSSENCFGWILAAAEINSLGSWRQPWDTATYWQMRVTLLRFFACNALHCLTFANRCTQRYETICLPLSV